MKGDSRIPKANSVDEQIDQWVHELYGPTEEEIGIVEGKKLKL